jgi:glycosyltransferase involved in cell wall biosynthesis
MQLRDSPQMNAMVSNTLSGDSPLPPRRRKLAVLMSHPIQYQVPLLRRLSEESSLDVTVYFMSDRGTRAGFVKGYGETVKWDIPLLDGYRYEFLRNVSPEKDNPSLWSKFHPGVLRALWSGNYDAVYVHGYRSLTEWLTMGAAKALRIPVLFHGDVLIDSPGFQDGFTAGRSVLRRAVCRLTDAALALSSRAVMFYKRYGIPDERVFWAPLCVDNEYWTTRIEHQRTRRRELRTELGLDPDLPIILYVAHMRPNKRPLDVVLAYERMKTSASLVLVGNGPLYEEAVRYKLEHKLDRVVFAGFRGQSELPGFYALSDLFVLPSGPGEVTPLVLHEAMCGELPLVVSDAVPSTIDFVREGENGFTYPLADIAALTDRFDRILGDRTVQQRMGKRSREMIADWNYGVTIAGILKAMDSVVAEPASSHS